MAALGRKSIEIRNRILMMKMSQNEGGRASQRRKEREQLMCVLVVQPL